MYQEKCIPVKGAELFCRILGQGDPLIVLHGGAGYLTHDYLLPYLNRLAENNLVLFYDQRGLGGSTGEISAEEITVDAYVKDIEAIRLFLGAEKISLLGHSWGSFLGMHYALSYPDSVDKLILTSSMSASSEDLPTFFEELTKRLVPYREEQQKIESSAPYQAGDPETVVKNLTITFQTYMYNPENICKLNLNRSRDSVLNGFKIWDIFKEHVFMKPYNLLEALSTLPCQTLIIHGDFDPIPFKSAEELHKAIPLSTLVKIKNCGHFAYVEQPESFFEPIKKFLKSAIGQK